jgi:peptidoglycan L-alanyl-D-glutamate endopeptidase CwlK
MKDNITLERIKLIHPKLREEVMEIYDEINEALIGSAMCRFSHTLRTFAEQNVLYAQGRTKPGKIVTNAKGGLSYHNYGMAIDIVLIANGAASWDSGKDFDADGKADWMEVVSIFKQFGWEAGIDWKFRDAPHFQKSLGYSVRQLLALHQSGIVDKNGFVKI